MSIPPATSTSLNNHPGSPSDIFVPNLNMTRYSPLLYEHTYVLLHLLMFMPYSLITTSKVSCTREVRSRIQILGSVYTPQNLSMSVIISILELIGVPHKNSVYILTSKRTEYAMMVTGNDWCKF